MRKCKHSECGICGRTYKPAGLFTRGWYDPCNGTEDEINNCSFWNGKNKDRIE